MASTITSTITSTIILVSCLPLVSVVAGCGRAADMPGAVILHAGNGAEVQDLDPHMVSGVTEHRTLSRSSKAW